MQANSRTTLGILALMALTGGLLAFPPLQTRAAATVPPAPTLTITEEQPVLTEGKGATLILGLQTRANDSRSAQSDARQAIDRLRRGLRSTGVQSTDIKMAGYRIGTVPDKAGQGTAVWQQVVVNVTDAERLGAVIDAAVASGATMVQGTADQFVAPSSGARAAAVVAAVRAARDDAQAIARAMGERLGRPVSVGVRLRQMATPAPRYLMQVRVTFNR